MTVPPPNPDLLRFLSAYAGSMVVPKRRSRKQLLGSRQGFSNVCR